MRYVQVSNIVFFYRYEEFHPFLFAQHANSHYVEFDTFDKVNFRISVLYMYLFTLCICWENVIVSHTYLLYQNYIGIVIRLRYEITSVSLAPLRLGSGRILLQDGESED